MAVSEANYCLFQRLPFQFQYKSSIAIYPFQNYFIMYNTFSSNTGYYDRSNLQSSKSNFQQRCEQTFPLERFKDTKTATWNIEESKENITLSRDRPYTASVTQLPKSEFSGYQSSEYNITKAWEKTTPTLARSKGTASSKAIKFLAEADQQQRAVRPYSKKAADYKSYSSKKDNLKQITMSLGYKSNLKDILPNCKYDDYKYSKQSGLDKSTKGLNSYKSMTRIGVNQDEPKSATLSRANYEVIKSYKDLADKLNDYKFSKKQDKNPPVFPPQMNLPPNPKRNIDEFTKMRSQVKKMSQDENVGVEKESSETKKIMTVDLGTKPSSQSLSSKNKVSIHDFELGKCMGEGAFGQVYPAVHKATRMLVAIKKVPKQKVKYMLEQFINQIKIQMFLQHPNVVKLYGFFEDALHFYIIMEYMEGGNLFSLIKKQKKLTEAEASQRLKQICTGLKQMHDNSILHRDIKPQNIVMTNGVCKLCDLGWAAICKDRRTTYCGTLDYVSPQIIGGQGYDDSVDIWCVGVLAYEMICGKTPFYNISRKETMKRIVDVNYEYPPEVSTKAKTFIDKILKKNPSERFDIDEVLRDRFLQG